MPQQEVSALQGRAVPPKVMPALPDPLLSGTKPEQVQKGLKLG